VGRSEIFSRLRDEGIGVNVHYIPVHLHPFYRQRYGYKAGLCPFAEAAYERLLTLPIFPDIDDHKIEKIIATVHKVIKANHA
jgi:perosamine synthetase